MGLLKLWLITCVGLFVGDQILADVHIETLGVMLLSAIVLSIVNVVIRPLLSILALPFTVMSIGFFQVVVNGVCLLIAASFVEGFVINGWFSAIILAVILSVLHMMASDSPSNADEA